MNDELILLTHHSSFIILAGGRGEGQLRILAYQPEKKGHRSTLMNTDWKKVGLTPFKFLPRITRIGTKIIKRLVKIRVIRGRFQVVASQWRKSYEEKTVYISEISVPSGMRGE